ncbi:MAG TPA: ABC transporter ATP-binding protein [Rectinemataceae bacterium]|nr:ABC transporter ATP-binding protein [Rectinemataceae bacterium]
MAALLEVKGLEVRYGGIEAVRGLDFSVDEGTIVTMIGANGAGKSSTLLALSGIVKPRSGSISLGGREIAGLRPDRIVGLGLVQVPEGRAILSPLSVAENLELGAWTRKDKAAVAADLERVYALFPRLAERSKQVAGSLSGGEQQMLAIGRAMLAAPRILLLDEPSMGLAPLLVASIFTTIKEIAKSGTTVLLVEQNARQALKIADKGLVLSHGKLILAGSGAELLENKVVLEAFLGKEGG